MDDLQSLTAYLINRWTSSFAGVAIACTLAWYLGPLIPGLSSTLSRALLMAALVLSWALVNSAITMVRRRRERVLAASVGGSGETPDLRADREGRGAEEVQKLRTQLQGALKRLRRARGTRGYLYEQPWFVLIGPPGSGKTTALMNAGLSFPLANPNGGEHPVPGVGGTRLCDWWFADEAVLIDTAGRYTTQDSDEAVDRAGWLGFLDMLARTRPRQPLNGIVVVVSLTDIALSSPDERAAHARAIRHRIKEVTDRLGCRLPVYPVFTKADRLAGFTEYFDDLTAEERAQVWGATFPVSRGVDLFAEEFRGLIARLGERLFERTQAERSPDRRAAIVGFPMQLASLEEPLIEFLTRLFSGSRLDPAPFMRGAYFTSATQEGTPIDRVTSMLAQSFGIDQKRSASLRPMNGRGYFLRRLLCDVVLGEALLVSDDPARRRRRRAVRISAFSVIGAATILACGLILATMIEQRTSIDRIDAALNAYRNQVGGLVLDPVATDDLATIVPALDAARNLDAATRATGRRFGLSQAPKLAEGDRIAYHNALGRIMLPRLMLRLENQLQAFGRPDFLFQATRVYLMLGSAGPIDTALVRGWMRLDWEQRYPGPLNETLRVDLARHLDALLAAPLPPVTLSDGLVASARATFSRISLAERVYSRLRSGAAVGSPAVGAWTPAVALGPGGTPFFRRLSGSSLNDGVDGFFTVEGFRAKLLAGLPQASRAVANESWVLGREEQIDPDSAAMRHLEQDVVALYARQYEQAWEGMLDDLAIAPFPDRQVLIQDLYVLSSPQSPMRDLLVSIASELAPTPTPASPDGKKARDGRTGSETDATQASLAEAFGGGPTPAEPVPGADIGQHFGALRAFIGDAGTASPLAGILQLITSLQQELTRLQPDAASPASAIVGSGDPARLLSAEAERQPEPVSRWLRQIAAAGGSAASGGARSAASASFMATGGPAAVCKQVVAGNFPFEPASGDDAPLDDFTHLFAPGGVLDGYFTTELKPFVTQGPVWRAAPISGVAPPVSQAQLAEFQRAADIRDAFFATGTSTLAVRFDLSLMSASGAGKPVLTLGQTTIPSVGTTSLTWPGDDGIRVARIAFGAVAPALEEHGAWALFRLLDRASVTSAGADRRFLVTFRVGSDKATYMLHAQSVHDPFESSELAEFRCPAI